MGQEQPAQQGRRPVSRCTIQCPCPVFVYRPGPPPVSPRSERDGPSELPRAHRRYAHQLVLPHPPVTPCSILCHLAKRGRKTNLAANDKKIKQKPPWPKWPRSVHVCGVPHALCDVRHSRARMHVRSDGGVRGIATGCSLRRLVARTLAKQFMAVFEAECAPFQYALSTRAGTDCVGHMLRAATDADPRLTILSVDGIGAYDHILRSAMLGRLLQMPGARQILPFVRLSYPQPSTYGWFDEDGQRRAVVSS